MHTQRRGRGLVLRGLRPAHEHQPGAGLRAHLQPAQLLGPRLRQPGHHRLARVGLDQLFGGPQPLGRRFGLDPHEAPLVQPLLDQPGQVRRPRRADHHHLGAAFDQRTQRRTQQPPFDDARLRRQQLADRAARPARTRQLLVQPCPAGRHHRSGLRTQVAASPQRRLDLRRQHGIERCRRRGRRQRRPGGALDWVRAHGVMTVYFYSITPSRCCRARRAAAGPWRTHQKRQSPLEAGFATACRHIRSLGPRIPSAGPSRSQVQVSPPQPCSKSAWLPTNSRLWGDPLGLVALLPRAASPGRTGAKPVTRLEPRWTTSW